MKFSFFTKNKNKNLVTLDKNLELESPITIKEKCNHKYQDFPPFIFYNWSDGNPGTYSIRIIESYVCPYCKERIDKTLEEHKGTSSNAEEDAEKIINNLKKKHPEIREKFEVEDMINDFILVDREYMYWYHILHGTQDPNDFKKKEIVLKL